ncbi:MAG: apolipoprotein N-acyltransferase [candidate division WOR-3 bacterium]
MKELRFLKLLKKSEVKNILLFILSLILLLFSFPPFYFFPFAFFSFIPLFVLLKRIRRSFLSGFLYGTIFSFCELNWIFNLTQIEKEASFWITLGTFLIFLTHGVYFGIFTYFFKKFHKENFSFLLVPLIYTLLEIIRSKSEIGFPWVVLFLSQKNNLPLIQIIEITGPFFITFLIVFFNFLIFTLKKLYIAFSIFLIFLLHIFGIYLLKKENREFRKIEIALYQPHIPLNYSQREEFKIAEKIYDSLSVKGVLISIFPESSIPSFARYDTNVLKIVSNFTKKTESYLIFGNADAIKIKGKYRFFNTAFLVNKKGELIDYYHKTHLTPFGEALPYDEIFPFLRKLDFGQGNYSRGKTLRLFKIEDFLVFVPICFESIFTEISREAVKKGANLLINITSDGWFGKSLGPKVHRDLAIFRAIETRRYLVRSARSGISCVIDEKGRILKEIPLFKRGVIKGEVKIFSDETIYVKYGYLIDIFYFVFFIFLIVLRKFQKFFQVQKGLNI